jgi:long-chain-alcohol oxidase
MGASPATSACDARGRLWGVAGLYVADGSALPTGSGSNPMVTIYATAAVIADGIVRDAAARPPAAAG